MGGKKQAKQPFWVEIARNAGEKLWSEYGGVSERHQRYYLKLVRKCFTSPDALAQYALEVTNHNPRGLCTLVFPDALRSLGPDGKAMFITPCGASKEGEHYISDGWAAAIDPNDSANIAAAVRDMGAGAEGAKERLIDALLDINIYPLATTAGNQNDFMPKKKQLIEPTVEGSHIWARGKSYDNHAEKELLAERIEGIEKITDLIGDGHAETDVTGKLTKRGEFVQWYAQALKARLNSMARVKQPLNDDTAHDLAAIICATLSTPGNLVLTPRKLDPNEHFYLMRFSGMSRCFLDSVPPTQTHFAGDAPDEEGKRRYPHFEFNLKKDKPLSDETWAKVVVVREGNKLKIKEIRPLERKRVGHDLEALTNPEIQEILIDPAADLDAVKYITIFGSEMGKKFLGFMPESVTSWFADKARENSKRLPSTQVVLANAMTPKK